jgi:hypothetical protein
LFPRETVVVLAGEEEADMEFERAWEVVKTRGCVTGAASRRLTAIMELGQTDFAHVVSTNYSQYNMWYFVGGVYDVKIEQDLGVATMRERTRG